MLCHTKGVSICPLHFDAPLYVWMPHMFGWPTVCLNAPHMFGCPNICGHPHMFGCPHMFEHPAVCLGDVWMPTVHTQHIESMLSH